MLSGNAGPAEGCVDCRRILRLVKELRVLCDVLQFENTVGHCMQRNQTIASDEISSAS